MEQRLSFGGVWARLRSGRWIGRAGPVYMPYLGSLGLIGLAAGIAGAIVHFGELPDLGVLFLAAVLLSAMFWGRGPALFSVPVSIATTSFFFYEPIYSFWIVRTQDLVNLILYSALALLCSDLAVHVRRQAVEAADREAMSARLYGFSSRLAGIANPKDLFVAIVEHLRDVSKQRVMLLLWFGDHLEIGAAAGDASFSREDLEQVERLWRERRLARQVEALPSGWRLRPLSSVRAPIGVLATKPDGSGPEAVLDRRYLDSVLDQAAIAIERTQLAQAYEDARVQVKTENLREALINSISHDLQTPLASILGSASALQSFERLYDARGRAELIGTIRDEAERLNHIIGNIVDLSRIRAGELSPRLEFIEIADIINAALGRIRKRLADHHVAVAIPPDLPMLKLDLFLMEHAFVNLLENAAKYAPKGTRIDLRATRRDGDVLIDVSDTGVGIAGNDIKRIFNPFFRAMNSDARPAGEGLGLTICRAFVEASGGRIEAFSPGAGKGATFRITLPIPEANRALDMVAHDE